MWKFSLWYMSAQEEEIVGKVKDIIIVWLSSINKLNLYPRKENATLSGMDCGSVLKWFSLFSETKMCVLFERDISPWSGCEYAHAVFIVFCNVGLFFVIDLSFNNDKVDTNVVLHLEYLLSQLPQLSFFFKMKRFSSN